MAYINREKFAEKIAKCSAFNRQGFEFEGNLLQGVVLDLIDAEPPADVAEVKHGEYVYSSTDDKWHCSECFAERPRNNGDIPYLDIYCCYKCGAIMDGRSDI